MNKTVILLCLLVLTSINVYSQPDTTISKVPLENIKEIYFKINKYRSAKRLKPLIFSKELEQECSQWAKECVEEGKFTHQLFGRNALKAFECMWKGRLHDSNPARDWYKSSRHNEIIMNRDAKYVGIAGYNDGYFDIFVLRILNVE